MAHNPNQFAPFVHGQSWSNYLANLKLSTTWGDHLTLIAMSEILGRPIVVHSFAAVADPMIVAVPVPDGHPEPAAINVAFDPERHYQAVLEGSGDGAPQAQSDSKKRRLTGKQSRPATYFNAKPSNPNKQQCPAMRKPAAQSSKKAAANSTSGSDLSRRLCGNCGERGHQAVTCTRPCSACGGAHKYFECPDPDLHVGARRQAARNRVAWRGYGSVEKDKKGKAGMKESGTGRYWIPKDYDPEYTPQRDLTPKRAALDKCPHASDRCRTALRTLWDQEEGWAMNALMDGGFLADCCLDSRVWRCRVRAI